MKLDFEDVIISGFVLIFLLLIADVILTGGNGIAGVIFR